MSRLPGNSGRKQTFLWAEGEYTAGAWTSCKLVTELGTDGLVRLAVVDCEKSPAYTGSASTGVVILANGYYDENTVAANIPERDIAMELPGFAINGEDPAVTPRVPASLRHNVAAGNGAAVFSAVQSKQDPDSRSRHELVHERSVVAVFIPVGTTGDVRLTLYSQVSA